MDYRRTSGRMETAALIYPIHEKGDKRDCNN